MRWLLFGYLFLFIHRPFEVWPILVNLRIELLYMLVVGSLWLLTDEKRLPAHVLHLAVAAFACAVVVCWILSPWNYVYRPTVENYLKMLPCYLLLVTLIYDERHLRMLVLALICIMTIYLAHSLFEFYSGRFTYRMKIVRLVGVDRTTGDPNSFSGSIIYSLPLLVPAWSAYRSAAVRALLLGYFGLACICVALTGSRGGLVGLAVAIGLIVLRSRRRSLWITLGILSLPFLWSVLPPSLQNRFETIIDPSAGPKNAQESASGRWEGLLIGLQLWSDNPLSGCGPGLWRPATGRKIESHNMYGQLTGEMGTLGVVCFGAILLVCWRTWRQLQRAYRENPDWGRDFLNDLIWAAGAGLLLLLLLGNIGHNLFRPHWLWFGSLLVIAGQCVQQRLAAVAEANWFFPPHPLSGGTGSASIPRAVS